MENYKGLYQGGIIIHKNNAVNQNICNLALSFLKYLAPENKRIERLDQTILSFVINKYFADIKVFAFDDYIFKDRWFNRYLHNTDVVIEVFGEDNYPKYLFNKKINIEKI